MTTESTPSNTPLPSAPDNPQSTCHPTGASSPRAGIFLRFAARSLKLNRTRTIVSVIGIALSCALITAIFTSVTTLYSGLLEAEIMTEGAWQAELVNIDDEGLQRLARDSRIETTYLRRMHGSALMPKSFEGYWGRYLDIHAWPTAGEVKGLKTLPHIVEGRAPEGPGEIVLPDGLKGKTLEDGNWLYDGLPTTGKDDDVPRASWEGGIGLGSELELSLGQRIFILPETGVEGPCIYDESLHTNHSASGDVISEYVSDPSPVKTYTVVGFYGPKNGRSYDTWGRAGAGSLGFVNDPDLPVRSMSAYIDTNITSMDEFNQLIEDYTEIDRAIFNGGGNRSDSEYLASQTLAYSHDSLLRYQGMTDDRAIWGTLYSIAAILSLVVIVASVSLIYNSFAIAVSERTRQFGLLSSLGASKRQLRRTVYAEALLLSAAGIPLGLLVGLAGTFVVFNIAGEGIGMLIDQEAFAGGGLTTITVNPAVLAVSAALALVTVLISAAVPAWRASRVSAVDAIRSSRDVRLTARERREMRRRDRKGSRAIPFGRTLDNLRLRAAGVPGLLSHRNLTRASAKGRVAVASLAVSVALIIISGGISHYLAYFTTVADSGGSDIRVDVGRALKEDETTADGLAAIEGAYRALEDVEGATGEGWMLNSSLYGTFQAGMVDTDQLLEQDETYDMPDRALAEDGTVYAPISIIFLDDTSWNEFIRDNGLERDRFSNADDPVAVALNGTQSNDGRRYSFRDLFKKTGTATLFTHLESTDEEFFVACDVDEDGTPVARYEGYGEEGGQRFDENGEPVYRNIEHPLDEVLHGTYDLPVGAIVDKTPAFVKSYASIWPTLVLPVDALPTLARDSEGIVADAMNGNFATPFAFHSPDGSYNNSINASLSFGVDDPRAVETEMNGVIRDDLTGREWYRTWLSNNAENVRASQLMYETVQLFINCFILITGAIAVANVFNTLTNSIILRRREFAMLKSIGMGKRAFWKMIALECLSYAWRGLAIGLALGAVVTFFIYQAMMMSFEGLGFVVPFGWVIAAVGVVIGVLALSTAYALHKSASGSIVQTLREDAI